MRICLGVGRAGRRRLRRGASGRSGNRPSARADSRRPRPAIGKQAGLRTGRLGPARGVFPAAHERLRKAAAALPAGTSAQPFVDALSVLVQAQADTTGFVVLHRRAEFLERHFQPELPDPDRTTA